MNREAFEQRMRALECFHDLRLLPGAWVVVRVDGRGFSRFTAPRFDKPFDPAFHKLMVQTAQVLLESLQGCYAYTESVSLPGYGRRKFSDLETVLPHECQMVLDVISQVFDHDEQAREDRLSPEARLTYHQAHSQPLMDELKG